MSIETNAKHPDDALHSKVAGCIWGGAAGDAFGGPIEGLHYKFIRSLHGGRVEEMIDYSHRPDDFTQAGPDSGAYAHSTAAGTYTDDTCMALLLSGAIIANGGRVTADILADYWMKNMDVDEMWHSVANSYFRIGLSKVPVRYAGAGNIPDNSSAMCIGPVGAVNAGDPRQAALDAYDIASLSHDGYSREAACIIAAATAEAFKPDATRDSVVEASLRYLPNQSTSEIRSRVSDAVEVAAAVSDSEELTERLYQGHIVPWERRLTHGRDSWPDDERHSPSVDPLESVPCSMAMLYINNLDYRKTIVSCANFGRDCDTIACMAGYIAGASRGVDAIPSSWIENVRSANPAADFDSVTSGLTTAIKNELQFHKRRSDLLGV